MIKRLNLSLTDNSVDDLEQLRILLEKRLMQRLSLAQVVKRMTNLSLEEEKAKAKQSAGVEVIATLNN